MVIIMLCTIAEAVIIVSLFTDITGFKPRKRIHCDKSGYSRRRLDKITASVIRKDRRRKHYGANA